MTVDPKNFEEEAIEISEEIEDPSTPPEVSTTLQAEKHLRCRRYWMWRLSWAKDHAKAMREEAKAWEEDQVSKIERHLNWHENGLIAHMMNSGKKTLQLVNGTLRRVTGKPSIKEVDGEAFFSWARGNDRGDLIRIKQEVDKTAVMKMIKEEGGEIPPGLDMEIGPDTVSITT